MEDILLCEQCGKVMSPDERGTFKGVWKLVMPHTDKEYYFCLPSHVEQFAKMKFPNQRFCYNNADL